MNDGIIPLTYSQYSSEGIKQIQSNIAIESPVSLTVNGEIWLTFQCTPIELEALAVGFLFNEGFLRGLSELENIHICELNDNVDIWLNHAVQKPLSWRRTSGCHGGTSSADLERDRFEPVSDDFTISSNQVFSLMDQFFSKQRPHSESGGVHTSALADGINQLFQIHDIGRHNTFDKISGQILLNKIHVKTPILLTSGRISSDMLQKAVRLRAPLLISMRSASQMAIDLAEKWGITLISGARRERFNLFTHPERVQ